MSLPPELWIEIFTTATYTPGAFDYQSDNLHRDSHTGDEFVRRNWTAQYRQALATKVALVSVSSLWRSLSIELLYNDIRLSFDRADASITRHLTDLARLQWDGGPVGRFTKRFDISWGYLEFYGPDIQTEGDEKDVAIFQFLQTCSRLSIFIVDGWISRISRSRFRALCEMLCEKPALRQLRLMHYGAISIRQLCSIPTLVSLAIPFRSQYTESDTSPIILPHVRSLALNLATSGATIPFHFPNLRLLSLLNMESGYSSVELLPLFQNSGAGIASLYLQYRLGGSESEIPEHSGWDELPQLMAHAPTLNELVVDCKEIGSLLTAFSQMRSAFDCIQTIGIVCSGNSLHFGFADMVLNPFPQLKTIRTTCVRSERWSVGEDRSLRAALAKGFQIEDVMGQAIC